MNTLSLIALALFVAASYSASAQPTRTRAQPGPFTGFDHYQSFDFRHQGILSAASGRNSSQSRFLTFWDLTTSSLIAGYGPSHSSLKALDLSADRQSVLHIGTNGTPFLTQLDSNTPSKPINLPLGVYSASFTSDNEGVFFTTKGTLNLGVIKVSSGEMYWQKSYDGSYEQFHYPNDSRLILLRRAYDSNLYDFDRVIVLDTDSGTTLIDREIFIYSTFGFTFYDGARKHLLVSGITEGDPASTYHETALVNSDTGEIVSIESDQSNLLGRLIANSRLVLLKNELNDNSYRIFNTDDGSLFLDLAELGFPENNRVAVDLPKNRLFIGTTNGIEVWDTDEKNLLSSLSTDDRSVTRLAVSDDGERLASLLSDGTIRVWDLDSDTSPRDYQQSIVPVSVELRFAPGGHQLVYGNDTNLSIIDTDLEPQSIQPFSRSGILLSGFDDTEELFYVIDQNHDVTYFSSESLEEIERASYSIPNGNLLAASSEVRKLLSSFNNKIRISDLDTGEIEWEFTIDSTATSGWLSRDGKHMAYFDENNNEYRLYDQTTQSLIAAIPLEMDRYTLNMDTAFSPDFRNLVIYTLNHDRTPKHLLHVFTINHELQNYRSRKIPLAGSIYRLCSSSDSEWIYFVEQVDEHYLLYRLSLPRGESIERLGNAFENTPSTVYEISLPNHLLQINTQGGASFIDRETGIPSKQFDLLQDRYAIDLFRTNVFFDLKHSSLAIATSPFVEYSNFASWRLNTDSPHPASANLTGNTIELDVEVAAENTYRIETSPDLENWKASGSFTPISPDALHLSYPLSTQHPNTFIRVFETGPLRAIE